MECCKQDNIISNFTKGDIVVLYFLPRWKHLFGNVFDRKQCTYQCN